MKIILYRKLTSKLQREVDQFEIENFLEEGETPETFAKHQNEKYYSRPSARLLMVINDRIIGRLLLHKRTIFFTNLKVRVGGIGGVCTHRDFRERGIATTLLKKSLNVLRDWGCDIAFLCTDIETFASFYGKFGFVPLSRPYIFTGKSGKDYKQNNGMIAPVNSLKLFRKILNSSELLNLGSGNW